MIRFRFPTYHANRTRLSDTYVEAAQNQAQKKSKKTQHVTKLYDKLMLSMQNVELIEQEMGITAEARWNPQSANWQSAAQYMKIREYQLAVDRLEGLVVSRLLELQKANIAGTCKPRLYPHAEDIYSSL